MMSVATTFAATALITLTLAIATASNAAAGSVADAIPIAPPPIASLPAETITVTGTRETPAVVHQHAIDLVHATGVAAGEVAAARWIDPVCPRVIGITDKAAAQMVEATVGSVAADGLPLSAVASFAAMVALAEIRPGAAPPDSVLGLFAGGAVLRSPTAWDVAFLRALYRLPLDRTAQRQRGRLVTDLVAARAK
jgi:hypothetical protein